MKAPSWEGILSPDGFEAYVNERYAPSKLSQLQPVADLLLKILRNPRYYVDFFPENGNSAYSNPDGLFVYDNCLFVVESKTSAGRHSQKQFTKMCCNVFFLLEDLKRGQYDTGILPPGIEAEDIRELRYPFRSPAYNRLIMPYTQKNVRYAMGFHRGVRDRIPIPGNPTDYVSLTVPWSIQYLCIGTSDTFDKSV